MTGSASPECLIGARLVQIDAQTRITPESTSDLRAHLQSCASCRARFADELALREALAQVPTASAPAWRPPRWSWRWALPVAAAALLLMFARFPAPSASRTPVERLSAAPIAAVFHQVERRFQLGSEGEPYVITTTYHSVITCKP